MPPCGCGGSQQPRQTRQQPVRQVSAATVPGGPGEDGYTWNGPQKAAKQAPAEPRKRAPARAK